jgi:hypothetical protein
MPSLIPYASWDLDATDENGSYIPVHICPVCGERIRETERKDWESFTSRNYGEHYEREHA